MYLGREGGLIRKTKIHVPMQELEPKVQGGLHARRGCITAGFYGI